MTTSRQLRWIFANPVIQKAVLCAVAAFAATEAHAQEQRLTVPSSDLFPLSDPLNPQLPPIASAATAPAQEPAAAPAQQSTGTKIGGGRTEISADEATFEPETHTAIFRQNVVLKDPDFNVVCDKLVAYLKHDDDAKPGIRRAKIALNPDAPKEGANPADDPHRTLDKAVAEMNPGGRLEITQDKVETDGSVTHSIGHGSKAVYNAITGTTILTGMPDATKGTDRVVATDEKTIITMMRNGTMSTVGPHKVIIISRAPPPAPKPVPQ